MNNENDFISSAKHLMETNKHSSKMKNKTNLNKIPDRIINYLTSWKENNVDDYIRKYGKTELRDLTFGQLHGLFSYAVRRDELIIKVIKVINMKDVRI